MIGVTRIYTYRFTPPSDAITLATAIYEAGQRMVKFNKYVQKVETTQDGEDMLLHVTVKGRDQWWIKKQVIYPVVGIFTRVGIKVKEVRLDSVAAPPDARKTRARASDGKSAPLDPDQMIEHDPDHLSSGK